VQDLTPALNRLNQLVDWGYEYPDAEYQVLCEYRFNDRQMERLREMYNDQF
jgi:hypothetical protein